MNLNLTVTEISNWIFAVIGIAFVYYTMKSKNTIYIAVRDKKNKIHKVRVNATDSEQEVMKKIADYMKKNQS